MAKMQRKLHRSLSAMLVSVLVLGAGAAALAAARADSVVAPPAPGIVVDDPAALPAPPAKLRSPMPMAFEAWSYEIILSGAWNLQQNDTIAVGTRAPFATFQWDGAEPMRGADLRMHVANRVLVDAAHYVDYANPPGTPGDMKRSFHPFSHVGLLSQDAALATQASWAFDGAFGNDLGAAGIPLYRNEIEYQGNGTSRWFGKEPCLVRHAAQGRSVPLDQPLAILPECSLGYGVLSVANGTLFEAVGREHAAGHPAVRFATNDSAVQVWIAADLPYPAQVRVSHGEGDARRVADLVLSGLQRGSQPWEADTQAAAAGTDAGDGAMAPRADLKPVQPWGPDDEGSGVPFPASEAYGFARDHPAWPSLRSYLAAHPGALTVALERWDIREGAYLQHRWSFCLSDGVELFGFVATRQTRWDGLGGPLGPLAYDSVEPQELTWVCSGQVSDYPTPAQMPDALPSIDSAHRLWRTFHGDAEAEPNGWRLESRCDAERCWPLRLEVGQAALESSQASTVPMVPESGYSRVATSAGTTLTLDAAGTPVSLSTGGTQYAVRREVGGVGLPALPEPPRQTSLAAGIGLAGPGSGAEAAGLAAAATLAGALYWLWPSLKAGAAGLFSRVRPDEVAAHPARQRLLALVEAEPGIHGRELQRRTGLANGTLEHHLRRLEAHGAVAAVRKGRYACYFPASAGARERSAGAALKSEGARRVLEAIRGQPGITHGLLTARAGLAPSTVSEHVGRLCDAGLVAARRDGRTVVLTATDEGRKAASF